MSNKHRRRIARKARYFMRAYHPIILCLRSALHGMQSVMAAIRECLTEWGHVLSDIRNIARTENVNCENA